MWLVATLMGQCRVQTTLPVVKDGSRVAQYKILPHDSHHSLNISEDSVPTNIFYWASTIGIFTQVNKYTFPFSSSVIAG